MKEIGVDVTEILMLLGDVPRLTYSLFLFVLTLVALWLSSAR